MNVIFRKFCEFLGIGSVVAGGVLLVLFLFILGPWLLFWSIETIAFAAGYALFIPLTFKTWLAAVVFLSLVKGSSSSSSK